MSGGSRRVWLWISTLLRSCMTSLNLFLRWLIIPGRTGVYFCDKQYRSDILLQRVTGWLWEGNGGRYQWAIDRKYRASLPSCCVQTSSSSQQFENFYNSNTKIHRSTNHNKFINKLSTHFVRHSVHHSDSQRIQFQHNHTYGRGPLRRLLTNRSHRRDRNWSCISRTDSNGIMEVVEAEEGYLKEECYARKYQNGYRRWCSTVQDDEFWFWRTASGSEGPAKEAEETGTSVEMGDIVMSFDNSIVSNLQCLVFSCWWISVAFWASGYLKSSVVLRDLCAAKVVHHVRSFQVTISTSLWLPHPNYHFTEFGEIGGVQICGFKHGLDL